jgi:hypothetical protein
MPKQKDLNAQTVLFKCLDCNFEEFMSKDVVDFF